MEWRSRRRKPAAKCSNWPSPVSRSFRCRESNSIVRDRINTVDTLRQLLAERPDDDLFLLIGADSLHEIHTWKDPQEIARLARIVAVNRGTGRPPDPRRSIRFPGEERFRSACPDAGHRDLRDGSPRRVAAERSIRFQTPRGR